MPSPRSVVRPDGGGPPGSFAQVPLLPPTMPVSAPGDPAERAADRAAERVAGGAADTGAPIDLPAVAPHVQRAAMADAAPGGLIVDDETATLTEGQMRKSDLLAQVRAAACAAADRELVRAGRDTAGCPYVERMLDHYQGRDAGHLERAIRKFAPGAAAARTAQDYVEPVAARFAAGVAAWVRTGQLPADVPPELRDAAMSGPGALDGALGAIGSAIGGALSSLGSLSFRAEAGGGRGGVDRAALSSRLGPGRPLDGAVQSRMEGAFGHSFARVRIHDDAAAAGLSRDLAAQAFTLGEHVAFAGGRYRPGTPVGDVLIAHELAHVVQQGGAAPATAPSDHAVEHDADQAAASAVGSLYAPEAIRERKRPRLRSGLRLSRCDLSSSNNKAPPVNAPPVDAPPVNAPPVAPSTAVPSIAQRSFTVTSADQVTFTLDKKTSTIDKQFSVFVPAGALARPDVNKVQIFFTPATGNGWTPGGYLNDEQGLREEIENTEWITIGVPALDDNASPNWLTISDADIAACLAAAGRKSTSVDKLRLTAHSRGHRALEHTLGFKSADTPATPAAAPTITLSKVDRVSVFDASYRDLGATLRAQENKLTGMQDSKDATKFAPGAIRLYDVVQRNISGLPGLSLSPTAIRAIVYLRQMQTSSLATSGIKPQDLKDATARVLPKLPDRGKFSTRTPKPSGRTSLTQFITDHQSDLLIIGRASAGLKDFLVSMGADTGEPFHFDAHHFLAAELGLEAVED